MEITRSLVLRNVAVFCFGVNSSPSVFSFFKNTAFIDFQRCMGVDMYIQDQTFGSFRSTIRATKNPTMIAGWWPGTVRKRLRLCRWRWSWVVFFFSTTHMETEIKWFWLQHGLGPSYIDNQNYFFDYRWSILHPRAFHVGQVPFLSSNFFFRLWLKWNGRMPRSAHVRVSHMDTRRELKPKQLLAICNFVVIINLVSGIGFKTTILNVWSLHKHGISRLIPILRPISCN